MLPEDDKPIEEYRCKAEECFEMARRSSGRERELFLGLAATWGKMAVQAQTLPSLEKPTAASIVEKS
jgi:hypothetical protein